MLEDGLHSGLRVRIKHVHFLCRIAFRHDRNIDLFRWGSALEKVPMVRGLRAQMTDEYIRRIHDMIERSDNVSEEIVKMDINISLGCRHRKEEDILE